MAKQTPSAPLAKFIREAVRRISDKAVGLATALKLHHDEWDIRDHDTELAALAVDDTLDEGSGDSTRVDPVVQDVRVLMGVLAPYTLAMTQMTVAQVNAALIAAGGTGLDLTGFTNADEKVDRVLRRLSINPQLWVDK